MSKLKVVGLGHKKFVGKDTAAKLMMKQICDIAVQAGHSIKIMKNSFADHLKDVCHTLYPKYLKPKEHYERHPQEKTTYIPELKCTVRDVWIQVGNKIRQFDDFAWIRAAFVNAERQGADVVFVPDVRYPNECGFIKSLGGILIKVENSNVPPTDDVADCALDGYDGWNEVLDNSVTLEELGKKCQVLMKKHASYLLS